MLFLLNLRISEPHEASMLKTVRKNSRNLSRICVKADPWGIPTCSLLHDGIEDFDYTEYIYEMPFGSRIPSLQQHFVDAQDQTPLPIWRPKAFFKYPDGGDLQEGEILR